MGWDGCVSVYASPEPQVTTNPAYEEMIVIPSERIFRDGFKPDSWLQVTETSFKQAYAGRGLLGCRCGWMILDSKRCLQHSVVYVQDLLLPRWASTLILFKVFPSCFQGRCCLNHVPPQDVEDRPPTVLLLESGASTEKPGHLCQIGKNDMCP